MNMTKLLAPVRLAGLELKNRVVMAPMCMYNVTAENGRATDFHKVHYAARALGQVGLIVMEATGVVADGRITKNDLGLWEDGQVDGMRELVELVHGFGSKIGIQLNHAGRKAEDALRVVGPSAVAFSEKYREPAELTVDEISGLVDAFELAALRAAAAGVDMIEIHGAHGYLINQFLSPASNQRTDDYGGDVEGRFRFLKEVVTRVRSVFKGSLWVRLSLTDYLPEGEQNSTEDWQVILKGLEDLGVDCIDVSTGGVVNVRPNLAIELGYQVPYTEFVKSVVSLPVAAVGLLQDPEYCESLLENDRADIIMQGRSLLRNPNWVMEAARVLGDGKFEDYNGAYSRAF
jgi:NADPH2 dehydrogenase